MAKDFSICDLPEEALLKMFDCFLKVHNDKDHTELARILGIPSHKTEKFRQLIDDLQMHNANPANRYVPPKPKPVKKKTP